MYAAAAVAEEAGSSLPEWMIDEYPVVGGSAGGVFDVFLFVPGRTALIAVECLPKSVAKSEK